MEFNIGDRVRSKTNDFPGLKIGEYGTVIGYDVWDEPVVEWDEFNKDRHDCDGLTKEGHGWFMSSRHLELVYDCRDLGQLPESDGSVMTKFLFDM